MALATLIGVDDKLVWIDCEMTGLDLTSDRLIEIAALVTDGDLNILGDGVDLVIHADEEALAAMPPVVQEMHARSGLTDDVRASTVTVREAEEAVLAYLREHLEAGAAPLLDLLHELSRQLRAPNATTAAIAWLHARGFPVLFDAIIDGDPGRAPHAATPRIDIDPETFAIAVDGELVTPQPATELPMAQRYFLF